MRAAALILSALIAAGCGAGSLFARTEGAQDRLCLRGVPAGMKDQAAAEVRAAYADWQQPPPVVTDAFCNLIVEFVPGGLSFYQGDRVAGTYEHRGLFQGDPRVRLAPEGGQYSRATLKHELGHFFQIRFPEGIHSNDPVDIMYFQKLPNQAITERSRRAAVSARLRFPAPRVIYAERI